jgi:multidrug transporter EmrE-like cation transporter
MNKFQTGLFIILAVGIALLANSVSAVWAAKEDRLRTIWFPIILIVSPLVFLSFGFVTSKLGVAVASGTIDSLLTISTIFVGLFLFHEINSLSIYQYAGIGFSILGIILMQFKG